MAEHPGGRSAERVQVATWSVIGGAFVLVLVLFSLQAGHPKEESRSDYPRRVLPPEPEPVLLPPPELSDDYFPCTDCHDDASEVNPKRRVLEDDHEDLELAHGDLWCLSCHSAAERDRLELADARPVEFAESWRLCTQCHGRRLEEWRAGVHGKRTGYWWGPKEVRTCVQCHDPHQPRFRPLEPRDRPRHPEEIQRRFSAAVAPPSQGDAR